MTVKEYCESCQNKGSHKCHSCLGKCYDGVLQGKPTKYAEKPQTNADRIRAMSDEELALFVRAIIRAEDCPAIGCDCDKCFFKEPCFSGSKWHGKETEWLKQPAEE